jgi:hypothetical protein
MPRRVRQLEPFEDPDLIQEKLDALSAKLAAARRAQGRHDLGRLVMNNGFGAFVEKLTVKAEAKHLQVIPFLHALVYVPARHIRHSIPWDYVQCVADILHARNPSPESVECRGLDIRRRENGYVVSAEITDRFPESAPDGLLTREGQLAQRMLGVKLQGPEEVGRHFIGLAKVEEVDYDTALGLADTCETEISPIVDLGPPQILDPAQIIQTPHPYSAV